MFDHPLRHLGWRPELHSDLDALDEAGLVAARFTAVDRGRHTTVRRELVTLANGALLIDTPGLRLVAPLEDGDAEVPLLDKAQVKRERRACARARLPPGALPPDA